MGLLSINSYAHKLISQNVKPGNIAIDATAGNGNDTAFLSALLGEQGKLYVFDIQSEALEQSKKRVMKQGLPVPQMHWLQASHSEMLQNVDPSDYGQIHAIMFNLGFYPSGDPSIITLPESTLAALSQAIKLLIPGGLLTIAVYPGHPGGDIEAETVSHWAAALAYEHYQVLCYRFINSVHNSPYLIAIEKRKSVKTNRKEM